MNRRHKSINTGGECSEREEDWDFDIGDEKIPKNPEHENMTIEEIMDLFEKKDLEDMWKI